MNSRGDLSFRDLYLKRLVGALDALKKPTNSNPDCEEKVGGSSRNIKLAADVSLALTANRPAWSRALLNRISNDEKNRPALRKILGSKKFQAVIEENARYKSRLKLHSKPKKIHIHKHKTSHGSKASHVLSLYRIFRSKRVDPATSSQESSFNKRRRKLQRLVPGGNLMGTSCLIRETEDYIKSLTAQVDVLQSLVNYVDSSQNLV
ncbi:hypothetical protein SUGI_0202440 [Cryptomeria japonica]|uniref:transcription factor IBH1 n=1 Tax=Cryptomeria japonica TaxID=3369 RepID=UPI002408B14D|nr:transcription factor IBH1 [Cryptomeria japonica]GLJ12991.1 hypothetical protein SUGI_0202440 [Cryptomeria japonica]